MQKKDLQAGIKDMLPILIGVIPFGMIAGISALKAGFSILQTILMSIFLFAGAAQLVIVQLILANSAVFVIICTTLIINLRFIMYSAGLAPHFKQLSRGTKAFFAYLLTDQSFAVSITRFTSDPNINRTWYYIGNSLSLWITWQLSTLLGIFMGSGIPKEWGLEFAIPLTFMVLLFKSIADSATLTAAIVGGTIAVLAYQMPFNLGFIMAAVLGVSAGLMVEIKNTSKIKGGRQ